MPSNAGVGGPSTGVAAPPANELRYDNDFRRFSLAVYAIDGVAEECLALQEAFGIDVNLLLYCAWIGARNITLASEDLGAAIAAVDTWHQQVVRPLRGVRRRIKSLGRGEFEAYRSRVKEIELEAEQVEQAVLFAHAQRKGSPAAGTAGRDAVAGNVENYVALMAGGDAAAAARHSVARLVAAARRIAV